MLVIKNMPANTGDVKDVGSIPGTGRSPKGGNGNPLQYSCWRIPWTEEPGEGATVHGVSKRQTLLKWLSTQSSVLTLSSQVSDLARGWGQAPPPSRAPSPSPFIAFSQRVFYKWTYRAALVLVTASGSTQSYYSLSELLEVLPAYKWKQMLISICAGWTFIDMAYQARKEMFMESVMFHSQRVFSSIFLYSF